jgi:predicted NAD/FAD-binding protein
MKIAIIGSGIAGLASAYYLHKTHDITVFEGNDYPGGHTHTHAIELAGKTWAIDTGFIVFNDWTYPNFIKLMDELKVPSQPSAMSFSVKCERTGVEYNGTTLNSLFAQRRNLFRPSFLRMIKDILRFNKEAPRWLETGDDDTTLGEYLQANRYSQVFQDHYIIPMGAAIWSSGRAGMPMLLN